MRLLLFIPITFLGFIPMLLNLIIGISLLIVGFITKNSLILSFGLNIAYSVDQLFNTFLMGAPDQTLSTRLHLAIESETPKWYVRPFARFVDWLFSVLGVEENHIAKSGIDHTGDNELYSFIQGEDPFNKG